MTAEQIIEIIAKFGFPTAVAAYLLYEVVAVVKGELREIQKILNEINTKLSILIDREGR